MPPETERVEKEGPKITIVSPSYNSGEFIERTILSVVEQHYPNHEHIIVDAGSTDDTAKIAKKHGVTFIVRKGCNQAEALNIGFRKADGEIIGWINSDDVYEPNAFNTAADFLQSHADVDMVYSNCRFIDGEGKELMVWRTTKFSYFRNLNYAQMIPQQTIFFRKSVFEKAGYIDESLNYAMDYDFLIRVSKTCRIAYIPGVVLAGFRLHSVSKTMSQRKSFEPEVMRIRKKHGAVIPYPAVKLLQNIIGLFKKRL